MRSWSFSDKIKYFLALFGGAYLVRLFWLVTQRKKSRVRAIVLNQTHDQILLVKNISYRKFHLPGGGIEKGESSESAIVREIKEELNLDIKVLYMFGKYKYGQKERYVEVFITESAAEDFYKQWELANAQWFQLTELPPLKRSTQHVLDNFLKHKQNSPVIWSVDD